MRKEPRIHQYLDSILRTGVRWIAVLSPAEQEVMPPDDNLMTRIDDLSLCRITYLTAESRSDLLEAQDRITKFQLSGFPGSVQDSVTVLAERDGKIEKTTLRNLVQRWCVTLLRSDAEDLGLAEKVAQCDLVLEAMDYAEKEMATERFTGPQADAGAPASEPSSQADGHAGTE